MKILATTVILSSLLFSTASFANEVTLAGYILNQTNKTLKLKASPKKSSFPSSVEVDKDWPIHIKSYLVDLPYSQITEEDIYTSPIVYSARGGDGKDYGCKFAFSYGSPIKTQAIGWTDNDVHCKAGVTLVITGIVP